jgi:uncharacterized protein YkwD
MVRAARRLFVVALLAFACVATVSAGAGIARRSVRISQANALEAQVLTQINTVRARHRLPRVRVSLRLTSAANIHSAQMAQIGYFAHASADGSAFWKRIARFYHSRGFRYWSVGENLLWSSPDVSPAEALRMWMASPEHRRNILTGEWREVGLSAVHVRSAPGVYSGREVTIITSDFGVRR